MKIHISPGFASWVVYWLYRLIVLTIRVEFVNEEAILAAWRRGERLVFACWHDELFIFPSMPHGRKWTTIVSASKDGEYLARTLNRFGFETARGSSSRKGVRALMRVVRNLKKDPDMQGLITVDGPRGPRHKVKEGVLFMAQKSHALMVPVRSRVSRKYIFEKAWDRFQLPLPFSTCVVSFGDPYALSEEKMRDDVLRRELQTLQEKLDGLG